MRHLQFNTKCNSTLKKTKMSSPNLSFKSISRKTKLAALNTTKYTPKGDLKDEILEEFDGGSIYVPPHARQNTTSEVPVKDYRDGILLDNMGATQGEENSILDDPEEYGLTTTVLPPTLRECGFFKSSSLDYLQGAPNGVIEDIKRLVETVIQQDQVKKQSAANMKIYSNLFGDEMNQELFEAITKNELVLRVRETEINDFFRRSSLKRDEKVDFAKLSTLHLLQLKSQFNACLIEVKRENPHIASLYKSFLANRP